MSSSKKNLSEHQDIPDASEFKIHIAVSDWNEEITHTLLKGAIDTLVSAGMTEEGITVVHVPGSFELPIAAKTLLSSKASDAVICLGCVIKGDTRHDEYINQAVATGLTQLSVLSGKPVIFGVLTVENEQQAVDRAGGKHGNKGIEAAVTAIKMVDMQKGINKPKSSIGF